MADARPRTTGASFVTDDDETIAIRTDRIRSVWLAVEDDETKGLVTWTDEVGPGSTIPEKQARQIIRNLSEKCGSEARNLETILDRMDDLADQDGFPGFTP